MVVRAPGAPGLWKAHRDAATAHCGGGVVAGRVLACARRLPAAVVRTASWMWSVRWARRKAVTRLVRRGGGGGGIPPGAGGMLAVWVPTLTIGAGERSIAS